MVRQLLVECSDPGLVVSLEEELEHVLRNVDFQRARELQSKLSKLAHRLGSDFSEIWGGFHLEVAHDGHDVPPSFGNRNDVDEQKLKEFIARAADDGIGNFRIRSTLLLSQGGPTSATREQYVQDLASSIRYASWQESKWDGCSFAFPKDMEEYRGKLIDEYVRPLLQENASRPLLGHKWVQESIGSMQKKLEEIDIRATAVMEYELSKCDPAGLSFPEKIRWLVLACSVGKEVEKWYTACAQELDYLYQQVTLLGELWNSCQGFGRAIPFLRERFTELLEALPSVYTADGIQAIQKVFDELQRPPWYRSLEFPTEKEGVETEDAEPVPDES